MLADILLLLGLILVNGVLAMSELAIVSARRVRLTQLAKTGDARAARALVLARDPTRFLSTVQVGMTAIGILRGAIGEETVGVRLSAGVAQIPALAPYADVLSTTVVVVGLTYAALILGELVPKHLALTQLLT